MTYLGNYWRNNRRTCSQRHDANRKNVIDFVSEKERIQSPKAEAKPENVPISDLSDGDTESLPSLESIAYNKDNDIK